jgi:hypothetical protein
MVRVCDKKECSLFVNWLGIWQENTTPTKSQFIRGKLGQKSTSQIKEDDGFENI